MARRSKKRPYGWGQVYQRGGTYWYRIGNIREPGGNSYEEAVAALDIIREELRKGTYQPGLRNLLVGSLIESHLDDLRENEAASLASAESHSKPLQEFFGKCRYLDLRPKLVRSYIAKCRADGYSPASIHRQLEILRAALRRAWKDEIIERVPHIPMPKVKNTRKVFLTEAEVNRLMKVAPDYLADVIQFAYGTGWRKGEILGLTWERVDSEQRAVRLDTSKSGDGRYIGLSADLWKLIERRRAARRVKLPKGETLIASLVFHRGGKPIVDLRKAWRAACKTAKLPGRVFHDLRRSGIRRLRVAGVAENVAMKISGHKTAAVFKRYDIVDPNDTREALEQAASARRKPGKVVPLRGKKRAN